MVAMELTHSPDLNPGQQLLLTTKLKGKHVNQLWMKMSGKKHLQGNYLLLK